MKKILPVILLLLMGGLLISATNIPDTRFSNEEFFWRDWRFGSGQPQEICFGKTEITSNDPCDTSYIDWQRFIATGTAATTAIKIYCNTGGSGTYIKLAVYSDSTKYSNEFKPRQLIWGSTDSVLVVPGNWVQLSTNGFTVKQDTAYWLAFKVKITNTNITYSYDAPPPYFMHRWLKNLSTTRWSQDWLQYPGNLTSGNTNRHSLQLCYESAVSDVYSGRGIGRGISRGVFR